MTAQVESVTTRWRLDPPIDVGRAYSSDKLIRVVIVERTVYAAPDRDDYWAVWGIPLTSTGKPNGGIDWRLVTDDAMSDLRAFVLAGEGS